MKLTYGYPFWLISDGLPYNYRKLTTNIQTDVVIIGAGISGALSAYYLTNVGIPCTVVDARTVGLGSTCASTSLLQYELDIPLHQLIDRIGLQDAESAYRLCGEAINKLETLAAAIDYKEFETRKSLYFTVHSGDKKFMQKEYEARKHAGFHLSFLQKDELKKDFGISAAYGLLSEPGGTINAYSLVHKIFQHCMPKGLQVYDRTCIENINYQKNKTTLTTIDGHSIQAKYIVNATGFEVVNFISKKIIDFYCTYAIISEQKTENEKLWKDRAIMWGNDDPYLYMRLTNDNRIIIGGKDESYSNSVIKEPVLEKKAKQLQQDFKKLFAGITFKTEFAWCGTFGKTKDALPYIGAYPKTPNTLYALGFGGNGITFSLLAAEIITAIIQGEKHENAALFSFNR